MTGTSRGTQKRFDATRLVKISFDPKEEGGDLQKVFEDNEARKFWLLYRPNHLVNQHFASDCLIFAERYRELQPKNLDEFRACFYGTELDSNWHWSDFMETTKELFPLMQGDQPSWVIERKTP
ncbi:hypothetical protein P12x_005306 [Tundrisphaera lichenicola]|uniref:hypothetical protein n=1 Tax=Tundrisphaera lichenicola TaxID=2029860 RepID=UPI003EB861D6